MATGSDPLASDTSRAGIRFQNTAGGGLATWPSLVRRENDGATRRCNVHADAHLVPMFLPSLFLRLISVACTIRDRQSITREGCAAIAPYASTAGRVPTDPFIHAHGLFPRLRSGRDGVGSTDTRPAGRGGCTREQHLRHSCPQVRSQHNHCFCICAHGRSPYRLRLAGRWQCSRPLCWCQTDCQTG